MATFVRKRAFKESSCLHSDIIVVFNIREQGLTKFNGKLLQNSNGSEAWTMLVWTVAKVLVQASPVFREALRGRILLHALSSSPVVTKRRMSEHQNNNQQPTTASQATTYLHHHDELRSRLHQASSRRLYFGTVGRNFWVS